MASTQLTVKQLAFIREYAISGDKADAAKRAGYDAKRANDFGARLLKNETIRKAIADVKAEDEAFNENRPRITKAELVKTAMICLRGAKTDRKWDSCRGLIETVGKLEGLMVEKKEIRRITSIEDLSDDELNALVKGHKTIEGKAEPVELPDETDDEEDAA